MSNHTSHRRLDGTIVTVPFGAENVERIVRDEYRALLDEHDSEEVLVITGAPTSTDTFRDVLGEELPGAATPYVTSLVVHATDVLNQTDDRVILSDALRRELLHRFLAEYTDMDRQEMIDHATEIANDWFAESLADRIASTEDDDSGS